MLGWFRRRGATGPAAAAGCSAPEAVGVAADRLRDAGRIAEAAAAYRAAVLAAPGRADLWVQLGNMLKDSGQLGAAENAYRQALGLEDRADTHLQLGYTFKLGGDRAGALGAFRAAVAREPGLAAAVRELAEAGDPAGQELAFQAQLGHGVEALLRMGHAVAAMRAELDRMAAVLPQAAAAAAYPVGSWGAFRAMFPVPAAPAAPAMRFDVVLVAPEAADPASVALLFGQIGAVQGQALGDWTLWVAGRAEAHRRAVALSATGDGRVRWVELLPGEAGEARCLREAGDGTVLLLAPGAMLDRQALGWFAAAAGWSGAAGFICDEEAGVRAGGRVTYSAPVLRQVVDGDTLGEGNVFGETVAARAGALRAAGAAGDRAALLARLGVVGHVPYPLVWRAPGAWSVSGAREAVVPGEASREDAEAKGGEAIAVVIPTRDNGADVVRLVASLRQMAAWPDRLEVLVVDNGTVGTADLQALAGLPEGVRVVRREGAFNWSALNNEAVGLTAAPLLVFLNDDMQMLTPGWDRRVRRLLARGGVGAVGAKLLYPDGSVQHAGVLLGWQGSVMHDGLHEAGGAAGPASRWAVTRAAGAVTGAFLATRRAVFDAVGGFDAAGLPVAYGDVDYCLRLREAGLRVLWSPHVVLTHHESKSRGADQADGWRAARNGQERAVLEARWGAALDWDVGVNPMWRDASLPFRLVGMPGLDQVRAHVERTGSGAPWRVARATG